jgi:putative tricarboxylic transport membrane protein
MATSRALHHRLIGAAALGVGGLMAWGATSIPGQAGYSGVGPNFLPWVVAAVLMICGVCLIAAASAATGLRWPGSAPAWRPTRR